MPGTRSAGSLNRSPVLHHESEFRGRDEEVAAREAAGCDRQMEAVEAVAAREGWVGWAARVSMSCRRGSGSRLRPRVDTPCTRIVSDGAVYRDSDVVRMNAPEQKVEARVVSAALGRALHEAVVGLRKRCKRGVY